MVVVVVVVVVAEVVVVCTAEVVVVVDDVQAPNNKAPSVRMTTSISNSFFIGLFNLLFLLDQELVYGIEIFFPYLCRF